MTPCVVTTPKPPEMEKDNRGSNIMQQGVVKEQRVDGGSKPRLVKVYSMSPRDR